jgi:hypothetical protein
MVDTEHVLAGQSKAVKGLVGVLVVTLEDLALQMSTDWMILIPLELHLYLFSNFLSFFLSFFFCGTGASTQSLYLEPLHQLFFVLGLRLGLANYFPGLASHYDPPDPCLLSS